MIHTARLMKAKKDVLDLLEHGVRRMVAGEDPQNEWVEATVRERIPPPADIGYWLLVLRTAQERAIGVVEAWLDDSATGVRVREHLTGLLAQTLATNPRASSDAERMELLVTDLLTRTPEPGELVSATRFVLSVLDLTDDTDIHRMVVAG